MYDPRPNPVQPYRCDTGPQIEFPRPLVSLAWNEPDPAWRSAFAGSPLEAASDRDGSGFLFSYSQPALM